MGYGIVVQRVLGGRKLGIMRSRRVGWAQAEETGWAQADACASLLFPVHHSLIHHSSHSTRYCFPGRLCTKPLNSMFSKAAATCEGFIPD